MDAAVMVVALLAGLALAWGVVRSAARAEKRPAARAKEQRRIREALPAPLRADPRRLVPRIRTQAYIEEMRARGATGDNAIVHDAFVGELVIAYAIDTPEIFRMLNEADLPLLGVDRAKLRATAIANIARRPEAKGRFEGAHEFGMLVLADMAATMLLIDAIWDDLRESIRGEQLASVPSRDVLLIADSHYRPAVRMLREELRDVFDDAGPTAISRQIFVRREGRWCVYETDDAPSDDEE